LVVGIGFGVLVNVVWAQCPTAFNLSGKKDQYWSQVTNNAWGKMLPKGWVDNGFHFYSQVRSRGPSAGINTPSDLESNVMKQVSAGPEGHPNRWQILLPIKNSANKNLRVIYDYDRKANSKCKLVTLSY